MSREFEPCTPNTNILVVEDNKGHAALIRKGFNSSSYREHVTLVETLAEARAYLAEQTPTLLITDLRLPDGYGVELLSLPNEQIYPVAIITSQGNEESAVEAMKAGAIDYIVKSSETLGDMAHITSRILREWHGILERKQMQTQLIHADKLTSLGTLVASVAHEINNPNSFIMLNVPNLADIWSDVLPILEAYCAEKNIQQIGYSNLDALREIVPKLLTDMLNGSERIKHIVTDLKNFARPDHINIMTCISVNDVIQSAISLTHNKLKNSTRHFKTDLDSTVGPVQGNYYRLEQVIINLLLNACDALPDINRAIHVSTASDTDRRVCIITVTDEGKGMNSDQLSQITTPFFTTKQASGGMGLGLTISSQIINEHSGTLAIDSLPGQGTTVTIELPLQQKSDVP